MSKFTKGRWVANYGTVTCGAVRVADCELNSIEYTPIEVANAHLIAAAPDMYALLESISTEARSYINRGGKATTWLRDAENLLLKARGEGND